MTLLFSFPDQSSSFTYGVEYGRLLEKIERGDDIVQNNGFPIRIENVRLLKETCSKYGYIATFGECAVERWVEFMGMKRITNDN